MRLNAQKLSFKKQQIIGNIIKCIYFAAAFSLFRLSLLLYKTE